MKSDLAAQINSATSFQGPHSILCRLGK